MLISSVCVYAFVVTKVRFIVSFWLEQSTNIDFTSKITLRFAENLFFCPQKKNLIVSTKRCGLIRHFKSILCYQQWILKTAVSVVSLFPVLLTRDLVQSSKLLHTHGLANLLFNYVNSSFFWFLSVENTRFFRYSCLFFWIRQVRFADNPSRCSIFKPICLYRTIFFPCMWN